MRISDWSSDVCSSDLALPARHRALAPVPRRHAIERLEPLARGPNARARQRVRDVPGIVGNCLGARGADRGRRQPARNAHPSFRGPTYRSEEHTSELQSLMRHSYAVFCLKNKNLNKQYKEIN